MRFLFFILFVSFIFADTLHITSKEFFYDAKNLRSEFIGDVNATKGKDNIIAKKMLIYFNKNKKPIKFVALGDVKFILSDKKSTYKGRCDKLIYNFLNENILLIGNVFVKKLDTNESISADKVKINKKTKSMEVIGNKKPINIIIKVNQ